MIVTLPEALVVSRTVELRSALLSALDRGEPVDLDGRAVSEVDLAGLQVLCAAQRSALSRRIPLTLAADRRSAPLQDAIDLAGLNQAAEAWLDAERRHG